MDNEPQSHSFREKKEPASIPPKKKSARISGKKDDFESRLAERIKSAGSFKFSIKDVFAETPKTFDRRMADADARIKEARADDVEGDIDLKWMIAKVVIGLLLAQTIIFFAIAFFQGLGFLPWWPYVLKFHLDEWSFRILISATLLETYYLMRIVVTYLFPPRDPGK
jgi:hypothetical protein